LVGQLTANKKYFMGLFMAVRKLEYPEKTTNLPQVSDKLYLTHLMLY
jgi:hypothetical protein